MESGRNSWFKSVVKVQSLSINHNEKFTKPPPLAIDTHENLVELPWTVTSSLLIVPMINLIDIERRHHHLEGDFCDITSCISLWGILRKNLRKRSTYINKRFCEILDQINVFFRFSIVSWSTFFVYGRYIAVDNVVAIDWLWKKSNL